MRAFIALELPTDFADDVAAMARRLSASLDGRFLDRSTYHLTLAFLGDIDDAEASRAMDALDAACAGSASVLLAFDSLGKFGGSASHLTRLSRPWPSASAKSLPPATSPSTRSPSARTSRWVAACTFRKSPCLFSPSPCPRRPKPSRCSRAPSPATVPSTSPFTPWS